ncbi:MAG: universal stress protein [Desulfobacteraceae bacterium]|jgi:nucleotide-binding universal stress UspA family protein|nr:universal stress protein [Desulfobacteraceae bacterium]
MTEDLQKMIVVPVDGSENALKSLDYINLLFGPEHNIKTTLFYVMPRLPHILVEEIKKSKESLMKMQDIESRNTEMAQRLLKAAKDRLLDMGFTKATVEAVFREVEVGIARDIVHWSEKKKADAVFITTRGRSRLETFFMGEIAAKVLEYCRVCPVWMLKGSIRYKHVLVAVDNSKNALRAVKHAGFMLSGTDVRITIFHSKRDVRRFISQAVLDEFPEVQKYWRHKAGEEIVPFMQKAKDLLLAAGLEEAKITSKVIDGSRSAAADILDEAQNSDAGTVFLGLRGYSGVKDYTMGSVTRKVLNQAKDMTVSIIP